jgi:hypothetical protein
MPPFPTRSRILYGPRDVPGSRAIGLAGFYAIPGSISAGEGEHTSLGRFRI